jgi:hypothetical protein
MDSFVLRWRALWWGRVWGSVIVLTLAWSIGAGLAVRAVTADVHARDGHWCEPSAPQPLVAGPADLPSLPLRALIAAPLGLYASGLEFALLAFGIVLLPAWMLQQGTARRILGAPVIAALGLAVLVGGWSFELEETARTNSLPTLSCSN